MPIGSNKLQIRTGHTHKQETPSAQWDIVHNLNRDVISDVNVHIDGVLTKILPQNVQSIDPNTLRVTFSQPFTGTARIG